MKKGILAYVLGGTAIVLLSTGLFIAFARTSTTSTSQDTRGFFSGLKDKVSGTEQQPLVPPKIPDTGLYLGARVNPEDLKSDKSEIPGAKQIAQLDAFNASIGRTLAFLPVFVPLGAAIPQESLTSIEANGSIPSIQLACANLDDIIAGKLDAGITQQALAVKQYANPIFIRWYWEMNKDSADHIAKGCNAAQNPEKFVAAWRHIWQIFNDNGATNAAFIWCPSAGSTYTAQYYPGDAYVDWIAGDGFFRDKKNQSEFADIYGNFYTEWSGHGKPMMIGATGAEPQNQVAYFTELQQDLPTKYPQIKAFNYFNTVGENGDFTLQGPGLEAFKKMANDPYFMYR